MSAREVLPTGLALGVPHLPTAPLRRAFGLFVTLSLLVAVARRR